MLNASRGLRVEDVGACLRAILLVAGVAVLLWLTCRSVTLTVRGFTAPSWPQASCTILSSRVDYEYSEKQKRNIPLARVEYEYQYRGRTYRSDGYDVTQLLRWGAAAQGIVERYPPGSHSTCYVNPWYPSDAVLDNQRRIVAFSFLDFILLLFWLALIDYMRRWWRSAPVKK